MTNGSDGMKAAHWNSDPAGLLQRVMLATGMIQGSF